MPKFDFAVPPPTEEELENPRAHALLDAQRFHAFSQALNTVCAMIDKQQKILWIVVAATVLNLAGFDLSAIIGFVFAAL